MDFLKRKGKFTIGGIPVEIKKITIAQWKQLFGVVESLPSLIIDVLTAPKEDRTAYFVVAAERSFDEVTNIVSVLTGIGTEDIEQKASLDEIIEYFVRMAEVNDFNSIAKNVRSVLALTMKNLSESANPSSNSQEKQ